MKKIVFCGALLVSTAQVHAAWRYQAWEDPIDGSRMRRAGVESTVAADPATLVLQRAEGGETTVMITIRRGQFWCPQRCDVKMRFDDKLPPLTVSARPAEDGSSDVLFLGGERFVLEELLAAKRVRVELPLFRAGLRIYTFEVKGLRWELPAPSAVYSLPEQSSPREDWGGESRR
ncbi:hypothetical protein ACFJIX_17915 [Roseateles sp. UC29_93]|uniref:hypothetical protein n=1 Tax=Roseateles sp. UC29_93 TaxID=3350177 RepID=UPI00366B6ECC